MLELFIGSAYAQMAGEPLRSKTAGGAAGEAA